MAKDQEIVRKTFPHDKKGKNLPTVRNGYDPSAIFSNLQEHGHGEVEVSTRRVTPPAVIVRKGVIRGAEVGRRYQYRRAPGVTPLRVFVALYFKTSTTTLSIVEESRAKRRRVYAVTLAVQITVATCPTCKKKRTKVMILLLDF